MFIVPLNIFLILTIIFAIAIVVISNYDSYGLLLVFFAVPAVVIYVLGVFFIYFYFYINNKKRLRNNEKIVFNININKYLYIGTFIISLFILYLLIGSEIKQKYIIEHSINIEAKQERLDLVNKKIKILRNKYKNIDDYIIFAAGEYKGKKLDFQIDDSGHIATVTNLYINYADKPIILFIGNYEPTIWNILKTSDTNIDAIVIGGYYKQIINSSLKNSDITIIYDDTTDDRESYGYFYVKKNKFRAANKVSRRLFNKSVDKFFTGDNGVIYIGNKLFNGYKSIGNDEKPLNFYKS